MAGYGWGERGRLRWEDGPAGSRNASLACVAIKLGLLVWSARLVLNGTDELG